MEPQVYSDDIGAISLSGPIVRIDLMVQSATQQDKDKKPKLVIQQQVIMPIEAFLRAAGKIQGAVTELEKKGMITRKPRQKDSKPAQSTKSEPLV
jgi:hypothetical protein